MDLKAPFISDTFHEVAVRLFHYQAEQNPVYGTWLQALGFDAIKKANVQRVEDIPFLPIETFKTQTVKTGDF